MEDIIGQISKTPLC